MRTQARRSSKSSIPSAAFSSGRSLGIVALLFVLGLVRGMKFFEMFMTSVSLAVAAVPEGLPAVVTVSLALGVMRMSRRRALVRKLPAVETLGSTTVICTDKTGTLTVGEMTVRALYVAGQNYEVTGEGYEPNGEVRFEGKASDARHAGPLLELANVLVGCNNAHLVLEDGTWRVIGDPTEGALLAAGHKAGGNKERIEQRIAEASRNSVRLRPQTPHGDSPDAGWPIARLHQRRAGHAALDAARRFTRGTAVRPMTEQDRQRIIVRKTPRWRSKRLRVLGSAYRDLDQLARRTSRRKTSSANSSSSASRACMTRRAPRRRRPSRNATPPASAW